MGSLNWLKPEEYNEAPGECIVGAYWVPNEACEPNRIMVTCPFDPAHKMKQSKLAGHIVKCEKNFPDMKKVPCIYNALEFIDRDKVEEHHLICPHKSDFVQSNPNQIPNVDHSLVQSHLTNWEDDGKVKDVLKSSGSNEETESIVVNEAFPKSLRNFVGLENNTEALIDQGPTQSEETGVSLDQGESNDTEQDGSDLDEDSVYSDDGGNDAWSNSSVVGDVPLLESFNAYRAQFSDDEEDDVYVVESDDESSIPTDNLNSSNTNTAWVASSNDDSNLYNSVDFSKTCDPIGNIAIHRINHAEELFKRSDRLKAKVANFCDLSIDNCENADGTGDISRNGTSEGRELNGNGNYNNDDVDTIDGEFSGVNYVQETHNNYNQPMNNQESSINESNEDDSSINSTDSQIIPEDSSSCVLKIIDFTHDAPEQYRAKSRKPLTLSDLVVFPDEPEPFPYYVSKHDGLHTSYRVEDESEVFWNKYAGNNRGNPYYTENSSTVDYETSSQSSDSSMFLHRDQMLQSLAKGRVDHSAYENTKQGYNRGMAGGRGLLVHPSNSSAHQDAFQNGGGRGNFASGGAHNVRISQGGNAGHRRNTPPQFRNQNASCSVQTGNGPNMSGPKNNLPLNSKGPFNPQIGMGRGQDFSDANQGKVSKPGGNLEMKFPQRNGRIILNSNLSSSSSQGFNHYQDYQSAPNRNEISSFLQMGRGENIPKNNRHSLENYHSRSPRSFESNIHSSNQNRNDNINQEVLYRSTNSPLNVNPGDVKSQGKGRGQLLKTLIQSRASPKPGQIRNQNYQNHHQGHNYQHQNDNQGQIFLHKNPHQDQNHHQHENHNQQRNHNQGQNYQSRHQGQKNQPQNHHQSQTQVECPPTMAHSPRGVTQNVTSPKRGMGRGALLQYIMEKNKVNA
ncbi:hypothetical protein WDU94_015197 [Cyamophila willieti]